MYPNPYIKPSLLASLKEINWQLILDGTQKTLGIINQAIPVFYQLKPMVNNAKTLFRIAGALNDNTPSEQTQSKENTTTTSTTQLSNNSPIFYI